MDKFWASMVIATARLVGGGLWLELPCEPNDSGGGDGGLDGGNSTMHEETQPKAELPSWQWWFS